MPSRPKIVGAGPRLPDEVLVDLGAGLDLLVGVDADPGENLALLADRRLVADRDSLVDPDVRADVAHPPEDGAFDSRPAADVARRVDHTSGHVRVLADDDARREHRVGPDRRSGGDAAVVPDERRPLDGLEVVELDPVPHIDVAAQANPLHVELGLAVEDVEVRLAVLVQVPDVLPVAVADVAVERPAHVEQEREELLRPVVRAVVRDVAEHLGLDHVDAGVDGVREDLRPRGLLEEALDLSVLVRDDDPELERVVDALQADRDRSALLVVALDDLPQVDVAERVARDDEEGLVERLLRELDRAGGTRGRLLDRVADLNAVGFAVAEVPAYCLRHEGERHDDVIEAVAAEELHDVLHAGLAYDRHHRLRLIRGQRPEPRPLSARHDDGFHRATLLSAEAT